MNSSRNDVDRRRRCLLGAATVVPIVLVAGAPSAYAQPPKLDASSQEARRFKYLHDASDAPSRLRPEGARCANCVNWISGDAQWGGCKVFPGKRVNRNGWCTAWAPV